MSGIWVPLITPFRAGRIDIDALQALVHHYIDQGVTGFVALGTTAEAALLNDVERATALQSIVDAVAGKLPILVGTGGFDTREFITEIDRLERWDVTGYLVPGPAYLCPDQTGLRWHFEQIAQRTLRPIVLYNVPNRTGVSIEPETVRCLTDYAHIVAIKECVPAHFAALDNLPLDVLCGTDEAFIDCLAAGGAGGILASAHVCADLLIEIQQLFNGGQRAAARHLFDNLKPIIQLLFAAPNPAAIKAMLAFDHRLSNETRMPISPVPAELSIRLRTAHASLQQLRADRDARRAAFALDCRYPASESAPCSASTYSTTSTAN